MNLEKISVQIELGSSVSRITVRHEEPLTIGELGAFFIDAGLRLVKKELDIEEIPTEK